MNYDSKQDVIDASYIDSKGAYRWRSNDNPLFDDTLENVGITVPPSQKSVRNKHTTAALNAYIKAQSSRSAETIREQRAEARAAFGGGVTVVNMLTGEKYRT